MLLECGERQKFDGKSEECKRRNWFGNWEKNYTERSIKSLFQLHAELFEIFLWKFGLWQMGFSYSNCSRAWNGNIKIWMTQPDRKSLTQTTVSGVCDGNGHSACWRHARQRKRCFRCLGFHFTHTHAGLTCDMLIIKFSWNNSFSPGAGRTSFDWNDSRPISAYEYTRALSAFGMLYLHIKRQTQLHRIHMFRASYEQNQYSACIHASSHTTLCSVERTVIDSNAIENGNSFLSLDSRFWPKWHSFAFSKFFLFWFYRRLFRFLHLHFLILCRVIYTEFHCTPGYRIGLGNLYIAYKHNVKRSHLNCTNISVSLYRSAPLFRHSLLNFRQYLVILVFYHVVCSKFKRQSNEIFRN